MNDNKWKRTLYKWTLKNSTNLFGQPDAYPIITYLITFSTTSHKLCFPNFPFFL